MMSLVSSIGAPPTIGFSAKAAPEIAATDSIAETASTRRVESFIVWVPSLGSSALLLRRDRVRYGRRFTSVSDHFCEQRALFVRLCETFRCRNRNGGCSCRGQTACHLYPDRTARIAFYVAEPVASVQQGRPFADHSHGQLCAIVGPAKSDLLPDRIHGTDGAQQCHSQRAGTVCLVLAHAELSGCYVGHMELSRETW